MSIGSTLNALPPPDSILPAMPPEGSGAEDISSDSALSRVAGTTAFSSVLPRIQAALEHMEHPSPGMLDILVDNITRLQDSFMEDLSAGLKKMNADTSAKMTLRLDEQARLAVAEDHPDCRAVNELLARNPEFSAAFAEIAAQSAALRDLRSLHTMVLYASSSHSYSALASGPGETVYQLSLKGDMSHFYFTR